MTIEEVIRLVSDNSITLVITAMIIYGAWKGVPAAIKYAREKFDMFIDSQLEKDKEIIASVKEIQQNNTSLVRAIENIENRVTKVEDTVEQILDVVTK